MKKLCCVIGVSLLLMGCTSVASEESTSMEVIDTNSDYDLTNATTIAFNEDQVSVDGNGVSYTDTTVTILQAGTYLITGSTSTYTIDVNCNSTQDVKIVFQNASITSTSGPVLTVSEAEITYLFADTDSTSTFTTSGCDAEGETAVILSHDDLVVSGYGTFILTGDEDGIKANDTCVIENVTLNITVGDDGINVNDQLQIEDCNITVTCNGGYANGTNTNMTGFESSDSQMPQGNPMNGSFMSESEEESSDDDTAQAKGIKCDGAITVTNSSISVDASDDALHSNDSITIDSGTLLLSSGDDGIHADNTLTINDGSITVSQSYEGLEAKYITINGGEINITSSDDGINSADGDYTGNDMSSDESYLTINNGTITISAEGDGIDMNGNGEMNGGYVVVYGPSNGANGALDYAGTFNVNGGTLIAGGASGMQQSPSESSGVCAIMMDASGTIEVKDSSGNVIASYTTSKSYGNLVIASDAFVQGETYTIYQDGSVVQSVTLSSIITNLSTNSSMGGQQPQTDMQGGSMPQGGMNDNGSGPQGGQGLSF